MRIVITGAAGRVGRAALAELAGRGHQAVAFDVSAPPVPGSERVVLASVTDAGEVYSACRGADAIVHLAAYPSLAHHSTERVFTNNVGGCITVAEAAAALAVRRIIYASSITVYGFFGASPEERRLPYLPADEDYPKRPRDAYALSKWVGEEIFTMAARRDGLHVASLRLALVVGPDEYAQRGQPRNDRGQGGLWSYVDSRDVAQAMALAIEKLDALGPGNHPFNIGAADTLATEPLRVLIPRYYPSTEGKAWPFDDAVPAYSIERARRLLGYAPRYSWRTQQGT